MLFFEIPNFLFLGCRNVQQGESLLAKFRDEDIKTGNIEVYQLDISVLESVKKFATEVKKRHSKVDYLINNGKTDFLEKYLFPEVERVD